MAIRTVSIVDRSPNRSPIRWLRGASVVENQLIDAERGGAIVAQPSPVGLDPHEEHLRVGGALAAVGVLLSVGAQVAVALLAVEDVSVAFELECDLVLPADDDRDARVDAQVAALARGSAGVERQLP